MKTIPKPTPAEAAEEQRAVSAPKPSFETFQAMKSRGYIEWENGYKITPAGLAALQGEV